MKLFYFFVFLSTLSKLQVVQRKTEGRKLIDSSDYLNYIDPTNQNMQQVKNDATRLAFMQSSNKWAVKINRKLENMKQIVHERIQEMANNIGTKLHQQGMHPIIKYHQQYNKLMNPLNNPYLQMTITNNMMAPQQMQNSPTFVNFLSNLHKFGNIYAESLANTKSGLFDDPKPSAFNSNI